MTEQAASDTAAGCADHLTAVVVDRVSRPGGEYADEDRDRDDQQDPKEGRHAVVLVGVVDGELCGVDRAFCFVGGHGSLTCVGSLWRGVAGGCDVATDRFVAEFGFEYESETNFFGAIRI